jgi:serine protease
MYIRCMKHYYFLALIFLFGCGGGGGGGSAPAPAPPALVAPVTTLSISSTELVAGEVATITWSSTNATSCSASGSWDGTQATSGSTAFTITPAGSYTFSLSCSGSGGSSSKSVSVTATVPVMPETTLSISASEVLTGAEFILTWSSTNATACSASDSWSGDQATSGTSSFTVAEAGSYQFSLSCSGLGGSDSKSVSLVATYPLYTLSGTVKSLAFTALDGDVPNPDLPTIGNNFEPSVEVQPLLNPSQVVGHLSYDPDAVLNDRWDLYSIDLVGAQYASLETSEFDEDDPSKNDLDIIVLNSNGEEVARSSGAEYYDIVTLPASGTYYVAVAAHKGASRYVLTIGSVYQNFRLSNYSTDIPIEKNKIRIAPKDKNISLNSLKVNNRYNRLNIQAESFFNFKDSSLQPIPGYLFEISEMDAELARAKRLYKQSIANTFYRPTDEQIDDMLLKKYISIAASLYEDLYIEPSFISTTTGVFQPAQNFQYQWNHQAINLPEALNAIGSVANKTVVAVLDSGHPSKTSEPYASIDYVEGGYDFYNNDSDATGPSTKNHGAHVAGTIAASNDSSKSSINGMGVRVLPIKVCGSKSCSDDAYLEALKYVAGEANRSGTSYQSDEFPVSAVNMSLGGCRTSAYVCNTITNFIARTGIPVVVSSGNCDCTGQGYQEKYCPVEITPASCEGVIRVAASDFENKRAYYSNYDSTVDITAPGGDVNADKNYDGYNDGVISYFNDFAPTIQGINGTSMASPHVAGAIALMKVVNPSLTPVDIDNMLAEGKMTNDIDDPGKDVYTGHGLLDVVKAVEAASEFSSGSSITDSVQITPTQLSFAFTLDELSVTVTKVGTGDLKITGIYIKNVDGTKYRKPAGAGDDWVYGTYTLIADRSSYSQGSYQNTLYFGLSDGTYSSVTLTFSVGDERLAPDLGQAIVLLIDHDSGDVIRTSILDISSGSASYEFKEVDSSKNYRILVGSDVDDNKIICEWGEFCDRLPARDSEYESFKLDSDTEISPLIMKPISGISAGTLGVSEPSTSPGIYSGD